jgi:glyoxylase I family protein
MGARGLTMEGPGHRSVPLNPVPFSLRQLDHLVLRVRDLETMVDFYCRVLGCTVERRQDAIGLFQLRAGQSLIDLVPVDGKLGRMGGAAPGPEGRNLDHFCLRVDPFDRDAILAHLQAHGAQAGEFGNRYGAEGEGPSQYLFDPEGNVVELKGPPSAGPA